MADFNPEIILIGTLASSPVVVGVVKWLIVDRITDLKKELVEERKENKALRERLFEVANATNPVLAEAVDLIKELRDES